MSIIKAVIIRTLKTMCSQEHGKLCFEVLKTFSVPENHLPRWGKSPSEVGDYRGAFLLNKTVPE